MKEFTVNEFLKIKLENDITSIYFNNTKFLICRRKFLKIPKKSVPEFINVNSINESINILKKFNLKMMNIDQFTSLEHSITPEQEYFIHCSSILAWYENDYDSKLLHTKISIPLLQKITEKEDQLSKKLLKERLASKLIKNPLSN